MLCIHIAALFCWLLLFLTCMLIHLNALFIWLMLIIELDWRGSILFIIDVRYNLIHESLLSLHYLLAFNHWCKVRIDYFLNLEDLRVLFQHFSGLIKCQVCRCQLGLLWRQRMLVRHLLWALLLVVWSTSFVNWTWIVRFGSFTAFKWLNFDRLLLPAHVITAKCNLKLSLCFQFVDHDELDLFFKHFISQF